MGQSGVMQVLLVAVLVLSGGEMKAALAFSIFGLHFEWPHFLACLPGCLVDLFKDSEKPPIPSCYDQAYDKCKSGDNFELVTDYNYCTATATIECESVSPYKHIPGQVREQFDPINNY